ncbi:aKG-HExxH-type peptide beta-hydroxylase [Streptomyces sp. NPDC048330]|uniref:aKG-HExxH-type peptide beta-hydroxylase n=1 Tax=Streptomyces sp. NPDC048330 TaxID=3365533 RepID=UPI00371590DC
MILRADAAGRAPIPPTAPGFWEGLAAGTPGPEVLAALRTARRNRNLLLLRAAHDRHRAERHWSEAVSLLGEVRRVRPDVFADLLGGPEAGAWLARQAQRSWSGRPAPSTADAPVTGLARFAAAAALRAGVDFRIRVPVAEGSTVVLPGLGAAFLPDSGPGTATVVRDRQGAGLVRAGDRPVGLDGVTDEGADAAGGAGTTQGDDGPVWHPLPRVRLADGVTVRLDSLDPLRLGTATERPPRPLPPAERAAWEQRLAAAWQVLVERHPARAETVAGTLRVVVPLPGERGTGWRSASFGDATGLAALSAIDSPVELAADLVHEGQHSLVYALTDLLTLLDAPPGSRTGVPWSDLPRPPAALLQGAAAFLVTAGFWREERERGSSAAGRPYAHWRRTARTAVASLAARPDWTTTDGRRLLDAMGGVLDSWEPRGGT